MNKKLNIPVSDDLHRRLKIQCVLLDRPMTEVVVELIERWLAEQEK